MEHNEIDTTEQSNWRSHAFVSKLAAQVSLPYRSPQSREIVRTNGALSVRFVAGGDSLPYGRYPRLIEMWMTTMIKTSADCWDAETRTIKIGGTFRRFMKMIGAEVGGNSMKQIRQQIENLCACAYFIDNKQEDRSKGVHFVVAEEYEINWLQNEPQENTLYDNWIRLSKGYTEKLMDAPVPVNLELVAKLTKPMSLDIYSWLSRRFSYLHQPTLITWEQLREQFGNATAEMFKFRQTFKRALTDVEKVYPAAKIVCSRDGVTLFPSSTSVPTVTETRSIERQKKKAKPSRGSEWYKVAYGKVYGDHESFTNQEAQNHLWCDDPIEKCRVCQFDQRNQQYHGIYAHESAD